MTHVQKKRMSVEIKIWRSGSCLGKKIEWEIFTRSSVRNGHTAHSNLGK